LILKTDYYYTINHAKQPELIHIGIF